MTPTPFDEDAPNRTHVLGCPACALPSPESPTAALVRRALAGISAARLLGCVRRVILAARTAEEWEDVANAFDSLAPSSTENLDLRAACHAATRLRAGDVEGAVTSLASLERLSNAAWIASRSTRGER